MDFRRYVESEDVVKVVGLKVQKDEKDDTMGDSKSLDKTVKPKAKKEPKEEPNDDKPDIGDMNIDELQELLSTEEKNAESIENKNSDEYEAALKYIGDIKQMIVDKKAPAEEEPEEEVAEEK